MNHVSCFQFRYSSHMMQYVGGSSSSESGSTPGHLRGLRKANAGNKEHVLVPATQRARRALEALQLHELAAQQSPLQDNNVFLQSTKSALCARKCIFLRNRKKRGTAVPSLRKSFPPLREEAELFRMSRRMEVATLVTCSPHVVDN